MFPREDDADEITAIGLVRMFAASLTREQLTLFSARLNEHLSGRLDSEAELKALLGGSQRTNYC